MAEGKERGQERKPNTKPRKDKDKDEDVNWMKTGSVTMVRLRGIFPISKAAIRTLKGRKEVEVDDLCLTLTEGKRHREGERERGGVKEG